jgi:phosphatidylglycerophosphate synthase
MLANWITISRLPVLLASMLALYFGSPPLRLIGVGLLLIGLLLDTVDGIVARRGGQCSLFGSVLDIAADRTYELVLWVAFADLGLVPVAIPVIVLSRTALTDAFRSLEVGQGVAPFHQHRTALGRFLVTSTPMRVGYSITKTITFCGLALVHASVGLSAEFEAFAASALPLIQGTAWLAVAFCLGRGLPVIVHALRHHVGSRRTQAAPDDPAAMPTAT